MLPGGFAAVVSFWITDPAIAAAFAIAGLLLITGCNHFDGLLDLGDGLMAHGGKERRISALTDRQIGTGAFALAISIVLMTWAGLQAAYPIIWVLILSEVCAKFSMVFLTVSGKPFRQGIHAYLHEQSHPLFLLTPPFYASPLYLLPVSPLKLVTAAVLMVVVPLVLLAISRQDFWRSER